MTEISSLRFEFEVNFKNVRHIATKGKSHPAHTRLCQSLLLAHQIQKRFNTREKGKTKEIIKWLNITKSRLSQIMMLLLLSPQIQEEILFFDYKGLEGIPEKDTREIAMKIDWQDQEGEWNKLKTKARKGNTNADTEVI